MFVYHRGYLFPTHHLFEKIPINPSTNQHCFMVHVTSELWLWPTGCSLVLVPVGVPSKGRSKRHEKIREQRECGASHCCGAMCGLNGGVPKMVGFPQLAHGFSYSKRLITWGVKRGYHHLWKHPNRWLLITMSVLFTMLQRLFFSVHLNSYKWWPPWFFRKPLAA